MFGMLFFLDLIYCFVFCLMTKGDTPFDISNNEYNESCTKWRWGAWAPLLVQSLIFIICIAVGIGDVNLDILVPALLVWMGDLLFTSIRSISCSGYLLRLASCIKEDEPLNEKTIKNIQGEKINKVSGTAALIGGTISVSKHAKKAIKELMD
ncbi:MAG: hypothetical protein J5527_10360 [Treponema sp.]|nr:hypothetical protein [Treponema sp.]